MSNIRNINEEDFFSIKKNEEKIKFLLKYSILAPSTHNSQPWLFRIGHDYCEILYNPKKKLPHTDKENRGLYISLGACIENLIIAAKYFYVYKDVQIIMKGNHVAKVIFTLNNKNVSTNKSLKVLLSAITRRANRRGIYNSKSISPSLTKRIVKVAKEYPPTTVHILVNNTIKTQIAHISAKGVAIASRDPKFRKEISLWITNNFSKRNDGMPGYAFKLPLLASFVFSFLMRTFDLGRQSSSLTKKNILTASMICVISTKVNNKYSWLEVGRVAERIMLEVYAEGISSTINVAAIEINNLHLDLMKLLNIHERPQFLFSMGYMDGTHRFTPRFGVENKIIS